MKKGDTTRFKKRRSQQSAKSSVQMPHAVRYLSESPSKQHLQAMALLLLASTAFASSSAQDADPTFPHIMLPSSACATTHARQHHDTSIEDPTKHTIFLTLPSHRGPQTKMTKR
eukprot:956158-Amphidinium_carterae.1